MKKYDMTRYFIQQANPHLADVSALLPGMKVKIPSSSKVVQPGSPKEKSEINLEQSKSPKQTDKKEVAMRKIFYAHAHRRPMGNAIAYDQKVNELPSKGDKYEQAGPGISGICSHCHQPIYSFTPSK